MGIQNLHSQLKSIVRRVHLSELAGQIVGIDAKSWLYKICVNISCLESNVLSTQFLTVEKYFTNKIQQLKDAGINEIIFVLDGYECRAKRRENERRKQVKEMAYKMAQEAKRFGDEDRAAKLFKQSIAIDDNIVSMLIEYFRRNQVAFLVAPYEADAQLAHLSKQGYIDVVITEDSDLIIYRSIRTLFKLNSEGYGDLVCLEDLPINSELSFRNWSDEQLILFACLADCDYVENIPNVGIKTAHSIAQAYQDIDVLVAHLKRRYPSYCTKEYIESFVLAFNTYRHHIVYDIDTKKTLPLNSLLANNKSHFLPDKLIDNDKILSLVSGQCGPNSTNSLRQEETSTNESIEKCQNIADIGKESVKENIDLDELNIYAWSFVGQEQSNTHEVLDTSNDLNYRDEHSPIIWRDEDTNRSQHLAANEQSLRKDVAAAISQIGDKRSFHNFSENNPHHNHHQRDIKRKRSIQSQVIEQSASYQSPFLSRRFSSFLSKRPSYRLAFNEPIIPNERNVHLFRQDVHEEDFNSDHRDDFIRDVHREVVPPHHFTRKFFDDEVYDQSECVVWRYENPRQGGHEVEHFQEKLPDELVWIEEQRQLKLFKLFPGLYR